MGFFFAKMNNNILVQIIGLFALFFYFICWFIDQPSDTLWYIGIGLPWLSLIVGIILSFAINQESSWKFCYFLSTIIFVLFVSVKKMDFLSQIPYLASCISFIAYASLSVLTKDYKESEESKTRLKEQKEILTYQVRGLKSELTSIKHKTEKMVIEQSAYDDETDEVILLARNKVMTNFCNKLLNDIKEYEKMDRDLYQ